MADVHLAVIGDPAENELLLLEFMNTFSSALHFMAGYDALKVSLSPEQIKYLESIVPFDPGFPHSMVVRVFQNPPAFATEKAAFSGRWQVSTFLIRVSRPNGLAIIA